MKDRLSIWFPVGLVFLLALLTFWLDRMVQPAGSKKDGGGRHDPDYWVENFTATRMGTDGVPRHVLTAAKMTHYPDNDSTDLVRPRLTDVPLNMPPIHSQAQAGKVSSNGEQVWLTGEVKVIREAGNGQSELTVTTDYLHVIPDKSFVQTDRKIVMHNASTDVSAVGMELDGKAHVIKFLSRVKGQHVNSPKPVADAHPSPVRDVSEQQQTNPPPRQNEGAARSKTNVRVKTKTQTKTKTQPKSQAKRTHRSHRRHAR